MLHSTSKYSGYAKNLLQKITDEFATDLKHEEYLCNGQNRASDRPGYDLSDGMNTKLYPRPTDQK